MSLDYSTASVLLCVVPAYTVTVNPPITLPDLGAGKRRDQLSRGLHSPQISWKQWLKIRFVVVKTFESDKKWHA